MNVKFISHTQSMIDPTMNLMDQIAYVARVSNPSNQLNKDTSEKLIKYLLEHKHWSPFEMVDCTLEIECTRDIGRQILRHRSAVFQEFCLSGDTEIYFGIPNKLKHGKYSATYKCTLSDLYEKWINGSAPIIGRNSGEPIRMPMQGRIKRMFIKCFDEDNKKLTTSHIKNIFYTGKKPIFQITLENGKTIKTTKEHKFLTKSGFDTLENIVGLEMCGDKAVMTKRNEIATNGILFYQDKNWLVEKKQESLFCGGGLKYISKKYNVNYNTLRKWIKIYDLQYTSKEKKIIAGDSWNKGKFGYNNKPHSEETRRKMQKSARKGPDSNLWRGGGSKKRKGIDNVDALTFKREKNFTCECCGNCGGVLDIHHKIPVSVDPSKENDKSNWELLCRNCHIEFHKREGWPGAENMRKISRENNMKFKEMQYVVDYSSINKIEYIGEEDTYDLEIDHSSHNYVANGIIVHNSSRYSEMNLGCEYKEARLQDNKNRQNSLVTDNEELQNWWLEAQESNFNSAYSLYKEALNRGIAKEVARSVLPEGNILTRMYMKNNIRGWIHFISVRSSPETQKEHREIAIACAKAIEPHFPMINNFVV